MQLGKGGGIGIVVRTLAFLIKNRLQCNHYGAFHFHGLGMPLHGIDKFAIYGGPTSWLGVGIIIVFRSFQALVCMSINATFPCFIEKSFLM